MAVGDRIALFKGYQAVNDAAASIEMSRIYFYESNSEPCGIKDLDLRFIYANEAYRETLSLPLDYDVTGKTFEEMTGKDDSFTESLRAHELKVIQDKRGSFAREFMQFGNIKHPIPYVFLRTPYLSEIDVVSAIEFYAISWHKFSIMQHQDPNILIHDGKRLTPYDLLTDKQWSVLYMHCTGLLLKEIAEMKQVSISAIKKTIKRSTEIIQQCLQIDTDRNIVPIIINLGWMNFLPAEQLDSYQSFTVFSDLL